MSQDRPAGPKSSPFPSTVWDTLSLAGRGPAGNADLNALAERYWRPIYRFIRVLWRKSPEDAQDLTQEFFATIFDREFLLAVDPRQGNFRKFLLASLRNFLTDQERAGRALKRGGDRRIFSFDVGADADEDEDDLEPADSSDPERVFNREWVAEILRRALARLEADYSAADRVRLEVFRRYHLGDDPDSVSYRSVAEQTGLSESDIRNHLRAVRLDLREACARLIQETLGDPAQIEEEMALLFGRRE